MKRVVIDIETDSLTPEVIWCIVTKQLEKEAQVWSDYLVWANWKGTTKDFKEYADDVDIWIAHNGISFDIPVLNRLLGMCIDLNTVVDTFVVSRTVNYTGFSGHGLDEIGRSVGVPKTFFKDFSRISREMIDYCVDDVVLTEAVYKLYEKYILDPAWKETLEVEHQIAMVCEDMSSNGFCFNKKKGEEFLSQIKEEMSILEGEFQSIWPPSLVETNRLKYRVKQDGSLFKTTADAIENYVKTEVDGDDLVCFDYRSFNPGSSKNRIEKLWEAGWSPVDKSKTHYKFSRQARPGEIWGKTKLTKEAYEEKKEYFRFYGWTVSEENLSTLPERAPEGARKLAEWLTLEGRRSSLTEWLGCVSGDGRIHGKFWHIGAWTHRMSHSNPNQANISSPFHGEPKSPVEKVKAKYDAGMRALWCVPEGSYLVGADADGIQLRILAHLMKSDEYVKAIVSGKKEDGTDIHNLNRRALGDICKSRDTSKTFIYAWLLGAGTGKVARILGCTGPEAKAAVANFLASLPELNRLKSSRIPRDAVRGYFTGLDGRKVVQPSEYLMLAGYLQNGEACIMKHATILWRKWAKEQGIRFKHVDFVHDEWQVEVFSEDDAHKLGELQCEAIRQTGEKFNLYCPLDGQYDIGKNWLETH